MTILPYFRSLFLALPILFLFLSCSPQDDESTMENSLVNVRLAATPSVLNSFNLDVMEVQLRVMEDEMHPNAWISLKTINSGIHDLTDLRPNQVISLVDFEMVPAEFIYDIKIVLGSENSAVKSGLLYELNLDSAFNNGSKNIVERQFEENKLYEFTIEFNIDESVQFLSGTETKFEPKMSTHMKLFHLF